MTATTTASPRNVRTSEPPPAPGAAPSSRALSGDGRLSGVSSPGPLTAASAAVGSIMKRARAVKVAERFTPRSSDECPRPLRGFERGRLDGLDDLRQQLRLEPRRAAAAGGHVGHAQAELLVDDDDLAAGDDAPVDQEVDGLAGHAVQADDGPGPEGQGLAERHPGPADLHRDLDADVGEALELARLPRGGSGGGLQRREVDLVGHWVNLPYCTATSVKSTSLAFTSVCLRMDFRMRRLSCRRPRRWMIFVPETSISELLMMSRTTASWGSAP